jgi:hypothetical protein
VQCERILVDLPRDTRAALAALVPEERPSHDDDACEQHHRGARASFSVSARGDLRGTA